MKWENEWSCRYIDTEMLDLSDIDSGFPFSEGEWQRTRRFRFQRDRDLRVAAYTLLRCTLSEITGVAAPALMLGRSENQKPVMLQQNELSQINFNITHTEGLVAVLVGRVPCGIDTERLVISEETARIIELAASKHDLIPDFCSLHEACTFAVSLWTMKEAYLKARGVGLSLSPKKVKLEWMTEYTCQIRDEDNTIWYARCEFTPSSHCIAWCSKTMDIFDISISKFKVRRVDTSIGIEPHK